MLFMQQRLFCWYKPIANAQVHLYIRGNNQKGGKKWIKIGESHTDDNGFYSFGHIKKYCGPLLIKIPSLQHSPAVDYSRRCGILDDGRELDIAGKFSCNKK